MRNWYHIFPKSMGLSAYVWIIFCILPFYFIFRSSSLFEMTFGILMILLFFIAYRLSFITNNRLVYLWVSLEMAISIFMTLYFGYVYFSLFLAFFIGNIQNKIGFFLLYAVHLLTTIAAITTGFVIETEMYFSQLPFIIISVVGVILMPFNMYNRNNREKLEGQLEDANKRISQLMVIEERQRIARDLHDTLGQKLSLIRLKSDLARKLMYVNPDTAANEIYDINQTAKTALNEVREMVSDMRGTKLKDEIIRVRQIVEAAQMDFGVEGDLELANTSLFIENVLSMCLKEAVTNVIKHSQATSCHVKMKQSADELLIEVHDNGVGISDKIDSCKGHGLCGMRERLEFVNGSLETISKNGTTLIFRVPHFIKQTKQG
ncbi:two-component system sensor histidine kinase DesK [Scopulibacillus daqui]|uniref:histidine kinase n=1 Tax=Scopulibacillus daqui TaxID=1469162 RepID=A0ABS2PW78_9BACL|nr:sensor histidine kinase [Scopulibacillus daqui]MBM7644186.1 two-component system sensor histidine kinase DesK [Scopulibacillus daqui]